jgi:hypothetical protein
MDRSTAEVGAAQWYAAGAVSGHFDLFAWLVRRGCGVPTTVPLRPPCLWVPETLS